VPWAAIGVITGEVNAGVYRFYRPPGSPAGVLAQTMPSTPLAANQIVTATFQLGNSSTIRKRVTVLVHDQSFADLQACTFWLPPGQPLQTYTVRTYATQAWPVPMLSFYPSTVGLEQWTLLDNVSLTQTPGAPLPGTGCYEPGAAVPSGANPTAHPTGVRPSGAASSTSADWIATGFDAIETGRETGWTVDSGSRTRAALVLDGPIDLRGASGGSLTLESLLLRRGASAQVQVSVDGIVWESVLDVPGSTAWTLIEIDLAAHAGRAIYVRLLFDAATAAAGESAWWVRNPGVRIQRRPPPASRPRSR
jgi:hypothetical protein